MIKPTSKPFQWTAAAAALIALSVVYIHWPDRMYVGGYNDDATYIVTAQSLWHGSYHDPSYVAPRWFDRFWPGFPLFLMPFVKIVGERVNALVFVAVGVMLALVAALWRLGGIYFSPRARLFLAVLFALQALTLRFAGEVLSEPLYLLLALFCALLVHRQSKQFSSARMAFLGVLLGWIVLVRPVGAVFLPAIAAAMYVQRRWKEGLMAAAIATAVWIPFPLLMMHATGNPTDYVMLWRQQSMVFAARWLDHLLRLNYLLFGFNAAGISVPYSPWAAGASALLIAAGLALCAYGVRRLWDVFPEERGMTTFIAVGFGLQWLVHCVYLSLDMRYIFTLSIPVFIFWVAALDHGRWAVLTNVRWAKTLIFAVWLASIFRADVRQWKAAGAMWWQREPQATFDWMKSRLPAGAPTLGLQPLIYLYTRHPGAGFIKSDSLEQFAFLARQAGMQYATLLPFSINMPLMQEQDSPGTVVSNNERWIRNLPRAFSLVYRNPAERTEVYRLAMSSAAAMSYRQCESGIHELERSRFDAARRLFKESLQLNPASACAWSGLGIDDYGRKNLARASTEFSKAAAYDSEDVLSWLYLARINAARQDAAGALRDYRRARNAILLTARYTELLPVLDAEMAAVAKIAR